MSDNTSKSVAELVADVTRIASERYRELVPGWPDIELTAREQAIAVGIAGAVEQLFVRAAKEIGLVK